MKIDPRLHLSAVAVGWAKRSVPNIAAVRWARFALPNLLHCPLMQKGFAPFSLREKGRG